LDGGVVTHPPDQVIEVVLRLPRVLVVVSVIPIAIARTSPAPTSPIVAAHKLLICPVREANLTSYATKPRQHSKRVE
jgi:hypothetical protein